MTHAVCPACKASIDLSGMPPGSRLPCPQCGQGEIAVPPPSSDEIEELDASLEVKDEVEELDASLEVKAAPPARPRVPVSRRAGPAVPRRRSRAARELHGGTATRGGPPIVLIGGAVVVLIAAVAAIYFMSGDKPAVGPSDDRLPQSGMESGRETAVAIDLTPEEELQLGLEALTPGDLGGRLALAQQCAERGLEQERLRLLREVLLLDGAHAEARSAFGFQKYQGTVDRFRGKWLDAEETELARQFEPSPEPQER